MEKYLISHEKIIYSLLPPLIMPLILRNGSSLSRLYVFCSPFLKYFIFPITLSFVYFHILSFSCDFDTPIFRYQLDVLSSPIDVFFVNWGHNKMIFSYLIKALKVGQHSNRRNPGCALNYITCQSK